MKFSQRIGKTPASKNLQLESIDEDLRNSLWNGVQSYLFDFFDHSDFYGQKQKDLFCTILWHKFYKLPTDDIPRNKRSFIREWFFKCEWYEVYDFIEFVANLNPSFITIDYSKFREFCNNVLENEFSAFRFVENVIAPISNSFEVSEIESSITSTLQFAAFQGANIHLRDALGKLSDKKAPDYRNSIKESISAVESIAKVISGNSHDTLGSALDKIKGKIKLHSALERGFKQLYGYTSDGDGIRHSLQNVPNCDFEDAKYMLVSCSAFVNYLIVKSTKVGISFSV